MASKQAGGEDRASKASAHEPIPASRVDGLTAGDRYLLCSDGLSVFVRDEEIVEALLSRPLDATCDALVLLDLDRGGRDNVTVVAAEVQEGALHRRAA